MISLHRCTCMQYGFAVVVHLLATKPSFSGSAWRTFSGMQAEPRRISRLGCGYISQSACIMLRSQHSKYSNKQCCVWSNTAANRHRTTSCQACTSAHLSIAVADRRPRCQRSVGKCQQSNGRRRHGTQYQPHKRATAILSVSVVKATLWTVSTHCKIDTVLFVCASHVHSERAALQHCCRPVQWWPVTASTRVCWDVALYLWKV